MSKKRSPEKEVKAARSGITMPGDAVNDLREQETANYMIAEKEFGQQNENNSLT